MVQTAGASWYKLQVLAGKPEARAGTNCRHGLLQTAGTGWYRPGVGAGRTGPRPPVVRRRWNLL
eukprot:433637-Rhodomonas_salina.1